MVGYKCRTNTEWKENLPSRQKDRIFVGLQWGLLNQFSPLEVIFLVFQLDKRNWLPVWYYVHKCHHSWAGEISSKFEHDLTYFKYNFCLIKISRKVKNEGLVTPTPSLIRNLFVKTLGLQWLILWKITIPPLSVTAVYRYVQYTTNITTIYVGLLVVLMHWRYDWFALR